ncbi:hypothetical protein WR25_22459 [Diploscapter pachys]|uniref:Amino acid transporter transmembrane domain-containing protein n=1 Tax=Diploscapter pachys TaxID=2018661 RepID=A0A2A2KDM8_9BILA|nr:hypothetical protein WR25_22459 [Diploscapter pachys]
MGIAIYPFSMLRSPRHFWQIAVFAAGSSSLAAILLLIGAIHDAPVCSQDVPHRDYNFHEACMAYGTLLFAYGGHSIFPTIQMDMKKPVHFAKSIIVGFTIVTIYYISVSLTSVLIYGNSIGDIIIPSIQLSWVQHIVNVMIAIHVVTTIVIVFSPLAQQVEDLFKIPHKFGWQRIVIRTFLFWMIIFIGLTLPHFGPMMDLIGSSTMSLASIILPPLFYLFIRASCEKAKDQDMKPHLSAIDANEEWATLSE